MVARPDQLPRRASDLILDPDHDIAVSVVSIWEVAIKHRRRQATARDAVVSGTDFAGLLAESGVDILPVTAAHAAEVDHLPPIHGDPFDRLLIAQARVEPMRLVTVDSELPAYGDLVLLV